MVSALEDYLSYYKTCEAPGYAVLVTGAWGTGKTYQVKQALKDGERYYVSLFGLKTAEEVHSAIYVEMNPTLAQAKAVVEKAGETAKNMGGLFAVGGIVPSLMNAVIRNKVKTDRIIIFDDLERCPMNTKEIMGVINTYIEHHPCRVVIIANTEKLDEKKDDFKKQFMDGKEKIIGQTIKVEPQIEAAFDEFCNALKEPPHTFVSGYKGEVIGIFKSSGVQSLRILRYVIEDLARLYDCIDKTHRDHKEAMTELVGYCAAINIEVRDNKLKKINIKNRGTAQYAYDLQSYGKENKNIEKPPFLIANDKYPTIDLGSTLLPDHVISQMLFDGLYDQTAIQDALNNHSYFLKPEDMPPWKTIINFDDADDDILDGALAKMDQQLEERTVTNPGEMQHIFALRLMMAEKGIIQETVDEVVVSAKKYIDDLLKESKLPPKGLKWVSQHKKQISFDGYGYWGYEQAEFRDIQNHLFEARKQALENTFPEKIKYLLGLMHKDAKAFMEAVGTTNNGPNPYALIPILHHIPAQKFVDSWLSSPKENWEYISYALQFRYETGRLQNELKCEKEWVCEILDLMDKAANGADGFEALRIERTIPHELKELVKPEEKKENA
jgi:KAP family P-loop domain